ncbi:hypothetical protein [uncultured Cellulomonas sp.]|uniref:hypothetical protein n=1 Tax=uncultured Cellulomonas sp. TaxID=189682 RepID=UPI0028E8E5EF|nr:hypothetical protein [uncultured Cellulomonas sp.]
MSDDFRTGIDELMEEVADRHRSGPGLSVAAVERTARRRRLRHESVLAAGALAVVAVLALSATALAHRTAPIPPASTPSPPATPSPSVSPTPGPSPTTVQLAAKESPTEPDALPMTDATWGGVGPGWTLTLFSTMSIVGEEGSYGHFDPAGRQALFLVAPDGTTYRLVSLVVDGDAQVMWWDATARSAWVFVKGLGESWDQVQVDLGTGDQTRSFLGSADPAPVLQLADGRVLWVDANPYFPTSLGGMYWHEVDGSFSSITGTTGIVGDALLDRPTDRLVYLAPGAIDGALARISYGLTSGSTESDDLGTPPSGTACSVHDVVDISTVVVCDDPEGFGQLFYDVTGAGEWRPVPEPAGPTRLIQPMLTCGAPDLPWSPSGRALPEALVAQGWRDAFTLPERAGAPLPIPTLSCGG